MEIERFIIVKHSEADKKERWHASAKESLPVEVYHVLVSRKYIYIYILFLNWDLLNEHPIQIQQDPTCT